MTIARTGNKIVDQIARAKSKNQADERRAKTKAAKSGKSLGRMRKVAAGRKAAKSGRGRGIVGKVQKSGRGFKGILNYACDKPGARIIGGSENTKFDAQRDMIQCAGLRPSVKNPVGHIVLSLPPSTKSDDDGWRAIVDTARQEIGLDDSYSWIAVRHNDTDHDHVHIIFSRVNDLGEIFDDYRLGLRLALCEDVIEDRFNLPLIPRPSSPMAQMKKAEIEKGLRTGIQPSRMRLAQIAQIAQTASTGRPTAIEFVQKCASAGVIVRPNISLTTGKLSGFSFALLDDQDRIEYRGSKIGASWSTLQKNGVTYEQDRDAETLANLAAAINNGQRSAEPSSPDPRKVENPQCETNRSDQTMAGPREPTKSENRQSGKDHHTPADADRPVKKTTTVSVNFERMRELNARRAARRIFFSTLAADLTKIGSDAAKHLASILDADKTEAEIASAFIVAEKCSTEARELIRLLKLGPDQIAEILRPYSAQLKMESDASARMRDAIRSAPAPAPDHNNTLPTF